MSKITRSRLKELIGQTIKEMDFKNQKAFDAYNKKHKMRKSTKVNVGGKETTAGAVSSEIPSIRKVQITNADPDVIRHDHIDKTLKALEKAGSPKAKEFKKLGDEYKKIKADYEKEYYKIYKDGKGDVKKAEKVFRKGNIAYEEKGKELIKLMKESKGRRTTVKEVKKWMKTLEENRYKKTYASDARRVSWLVNNNLSEDYESMPKTMRKKWSKAAYGRERYLAKEYLKHINIKQVNEQKLRKVIRSIITEVKFAELYMKNDKRTQNIVSKIIKQMRLKIDKDYDVKALGKKQYQGDQKFFILPKHRNKFLELLMKNNINVRG